MKRKFIAGIISIASLLPLATHGAESFPDRPITIIVPYTPGDGPDVIARLIGAKVGQRLGQAVIVENKPGASGQIGLKQTAQAAPDGYTLGVGLITNLALAPHAYKDVPYSPLKDFAPVALAAMNYLALVTRPDAPFSNINEMITWAKANPDKLSAGTTSVGGLPHMSLELLAHMSGFSFLNVPYQGNGPIVTDLTGGRLDIGVPSFTSVAGLVESGRLKLLGITYPERDPNLPDLPTINESVDGYSSVGWFGFVAPAGTPPEIVKKLNQEINAALKLEDVRASMRTVGLIPVTESPEYFGDLLKREDAKFSKLVDDIDYEPM